MTTNRIIALARYLYAHEKQQFWPPCVLFFVGIFLISLVHAECPLPPQGILAFFALWGFIQTLIVMHSLEEDFTDGSFSFLMSEGFTIHGYTIARLLTILITFSIPLLVSQTIGLLLMHIDMAAMWGLCLNHMQCVLGLIGVQLTLCLTSGIEKKMTALLIFIPFWIPSFLYLVGQPIALMPLSPLFGLALLSSGLTLLLIQNAFRWRG
ncbi:MAG: hypothetical protein V4482_00575 [Pseudomonadota bacterium]